MTRVLAVIVQCDGVWQERFPVSVPSTVELEHSVREGAPLSGDGGLESDSSRNFEDLRLT